MAHAYAQGKGVLFFTGHFGYWEIQAIAQPIVAYPVSVLARPLDNPGLHEWLERIRTSTGNTVIYRQGAIRKVLRELAANRGVAILIDQHLHSPDVVYVDYFGRPAATTSALAALALRTGAPVVPVFALPLPGRPLPFRLRAPGGAAVVGHRRRGDAVHAAVHRRAGDVRAPAPRAVAVDAPAVAGARARAGRGPAAAGRRTMRSMPEPRRLLVVAPNWLGDAVMALPAIADLRRAFPAGHGWSWPPAPAWRRCSTWLPASTR